MDNKDNRKPITIYHVHFSDLPMNEELRNQDFYFGSISAIYEHFTKAQIGIVASSLYNLKLDEETNPIYENRRCRIKKSTLITKPKQK